VPEQLTAGGVPVYRDSGGVLRERVETVGSASAATSPTITATYSMASAQDGYNAEVISASPAMLMTVDAYNARAGGVTLAFYDKAALPIVASDTPKWTVYLPPLNTTGRDYPSGIRFFAGIAIALLPDDATGLMAGDVRALSVGYTA